jgi:hypothetical protein
MSSRKHIAGYVGGKEFQIAHMLRKCVGSSAESPDRHPSASEAGMQKSLLGKRF